MTRETYTRVTDILYPFSGLDKVNPEVLRKASERGASVHHLCGGIIEGLGTPEIDPELQGYITSFESWWKDDFEIIAHEQRFYDDELEITGQADLIIKHGDNVHLIDLKTSASVSKSWPLQLSAYRNMIKSTYYIDNISIVQLKRDGSIPKIHTYADHYKQFLNCYEVYKYFYKKKETIDIELI